MIQKNRLSYIFGWSDTGQKRPEICPAGYPVHPYILHRALDPHSFYADPDPAFFLNADPDPGPGPA